MLFRTKHKTVRVHKITEFNYHKIPKLIVTTDQWATSTSSSSGHFTEISSETVKFYYPRLCKLQTESRLNALCQNHLMYSEV